MSCTWVTLPVPPTPHAVQAVELTFIASTTIGLMQMVVSVDGINVAPANNNTTVENARTLGIALNAATVGQSVTVLLFGTIANALFSAMTLNNPVYLPSTGYLTQTVPVAPDFYVICGKYIGASTVFISIEEPIQL